MKLEAFLAEVVIGAVALEEGKEVPAVWLVEVVLRLLLNLQAAYGVDVLRAQSVVDAVVRETEGNGRVEGEEVGDELKDLSR